MAETLTNQIISYTGSLEYSFDNIPIDNGDDDGYQLTKSGRGGLGIVPYNGSTVTVKTGEIGTIDE